MKESLAGDFYPLIQMADFTLECEYFSSYLTKKCALIDIDFALTKILTSS
ncbi:hypothetical protein [Nisaea sp.]